MNLRAITVCVDYVDLLAPSLERWHTGTDRLVVVTSSKDGDTRDLCQRLNVETHVTDIFYANGAKFNKGAALSEAILATRLRLRADWLLTFDADIIPPFDWRVQLERTTLTPGRLYGAQRYQQPEKTPHPVVDPSKRMPQSWVLGFFCLFHASDPALPQGPLFDLHWPHAGNFDTTFCRRWPKDRQTLLPIPMIHLGEERANWVGRGKKQELFCDFLSKRQGQEDWEQEKMKRPPVVK